MNRSNSVRFIVGVLAITLFAGSSWSTAQAAPPKPKWTVRQATGAVQMKYPSGKLQGKPELENEGGKWQYAVMIKVGTKLHEVMVNANTGKIESEETVTPKEEAAENKAEAAGKMKTKMKPGTKPAKSPKMEGKEGKEGKEKG